MFRVNLLRVIFIFFFIFLTTLIFISFDYDLRKKITYYENKIINRQNIVQFIDYKVINNIDFYSAIKKIFIDDFEKFDLKITNSTLNKINNEINIFKKLTWMDNESKNWYNVDVIHNNQKYNVELKIHGAATTTIKKGGSHYKIKHSKKDNYFKLMRQYNLLDYRDELSLSTVAINSMAKKFGLMSQKLSPSVLFINGINKGLYFIEESLGKHYLFERDFELTNYTLIRAIDDFDNKYIGDNIDITLFSNYYKADGPDDKLNQIALGRFEVLLRSIRNNDLEKIKNLVDLEYLAKYLAFSYLVYNFESAADARYIYDHTTGKFKIYFRYEAADFNKINNYDEVADFNYEIFNQFHDVEYLDLFKILLSDRNFQTLRDKELLKLVKNRDYMIKELKLLYDETYNEYIHASLPITEYNYNLKKSLEILNNNLNVFLNYLNYTKIYIQVDQNNNYKFLNDSFFPTEIIGYIDYNEEIKQFEKKYILSPIKDIINVSKRGKENYEYQYFNFERPNIKTLLFKNKTTNKMIDNEKIYKNKKISQDFDLKQFFLKSIDYLNDNEINYENSEENFIIKKGSYVITKDLFFSKKNIYIEEGTIIRLGKGVSLFFKGNIYMEGTNKNKIIFQNKEKNLNFGALILLGANKYKANLNNLIIDGGSEKNLLGINTTGQFNLFNFSSIKINESLFTNCISDDGINVKNSDVKVLNSTFANNNFDQFDCDFCEGEFMGNYFVGNSFSDEGDGLDLSGSNLTITNNTFTLNLDKGLSVGENSKINILNNNFDGNFIGIAVKDGSIAKLKKNVFIKNKTNTTTYIKKKHYNEPRIINLN